MDKKDETKRPETKKRSRYEKPTLVRVKLNPAQAVLSICHASATTVMDGAINLCRSGNCRKASNSGDSAGHS